MLFAFRALVLSSVCWFLSSSLWIYPHSLSYFNEAIGGPLNGFRHLLGSNLDWGQDYRYVQDWLEHGAQKSRPAIMVIEGANASSFERIWDSIVTSSVPASGIGSTRGFLLSSVNVLSRSSGPMAQLRPQNQVADNLRKILQTSAGRASVAYTILVCPIDADLLSAPNELD